MIGVAPGAASVAAFDAVLAVAATGSVLSTWVFPEEPRVATDGGEELLDDGADDLDLDGDGLDGLELDEGDDLDGDLEVGGDDGGGDAAGGPDLEPRVDELEAQIENVSGQVNAAQHESEELREAMDRIEDNVRQLLDIYALVTQDANPFTDDSGGPMDMDIGETLDIFDTDDEDDAEEDEEMADTGDMMDDLDEMEAEAREEMEGEPEDEDIFEDEGELEDEGDTEGDEEDPEDGEETEDDPEEGTTFDDLKSEYESDESLEEMTEDEEPEAEDEDDAEDDEAEDDVPEDGFEFDNEPVTADGAKPYLATLPDGYGSDVLVMEWLAYLVGRSGPRRAARAIERYESFGWLGAPAAEGLRAILSGPRFDDAGSGGSLSADDHRRSLEYIARIGDGSFGDPAALLAANGGGPARSALRSDGGDR